ncbi:GTP pyrophosphokinase, partial [Streptomyces sp. DpondAA-F4a]
MPDEARPVAAAQPDKPAVAPATPEKAQPAPAGDTAAREPADGLAPE